MVDLERIRAGDEQAMVDLLEEAWAPLLRYVRRLAGDAEAAQDAAQEAFVRLWERRESWKAGTTRGLLFRIARNLVRDDQRREEVRRRRQGEVRVHGSTPRTPAEELRTRDIQQRVREAVAALPEARREVFELVRCDGLSYRDAAEVLDLSEQTVANQVSRALKALRSQLAEAWNETSGTDSVWIPTRGRNG